MFTDKLLKLHVSEQNNFNLASPSEAKLVSVKPELLKPELTKPEGVITPDEVLFLIPLCSMVFLAVFILMLPDVWKLARTKIANLNRFHQVPCRNCRFFTNNHNLWCAVHPSIALTKQALNCSDYSPQTED